MIELTLDCDSLATNTVLADDNVISLDQEQIIGASLMESFKRNLMENYVYGFITGLGVSSLAWMIYLRGMFPLLYSYPPVLNYEWYSSVMGTTLWLMMFALVGTFIGLMLGLSTIKERKHDAQETYSVVEEK